jgi:hypothetical protein
MNFELKCINMLIKVLLRILWAKMCKSSR